MPLQKITPILLDTYLSVINNSVGTKMFRNFYALVDGQKTDIIKNGELSCAFFVSSVLTMFHLTQKTHGTVAGTIIDLKQSGWQTIANPEIGSVLVWEPIIAGDESHKHIGFYVGNNAAISNGAKRGFPMKHHWTFKDKRAVEMVFWKDLPI